MVPVKQVPCVSLGTEMILALKIPKAGSWTLQTCFPQHIEEEHDILQVWK